MQRSTIFLGLLALSLGFILFEVKYEVVRMEQNLFRAASQIHQEQDNLHMLKAEWSHLNEPQRLQKLALKYLDVIPVKRTQVAAIFAPAGGHTLSSFSKEM